MGVLVFFCVWLTIEREYVAIGDARQGLTVCYLGGGVCSTCPLPCGKFLLLKHT